ncbi:aminotransferase class V-fold PLP-dependent enzyme [Methanosarcina hadiensis]
MDLENALLMMPGPVPVASRVLIKEKLEEGTKSITLVHNETSAGIMNPAAEIGKLTKKHDALFIMKGVTSLGGDEVKVDELGVDIAVAGSQKCFAAPPRMAAVSVSEKALGAMDSIKKRPYYNDLKAYKKSGDRPRPETPYTPAIPLLFPRLNEYSQYSNTITAMKSPSGVDEEDIKNDMKKRGVIIAGGQERLKSKIFRIGSMGNVTARDVLSTVQQLEIVLNKRGHIDSVGAGTEAAASVLDRL